MQDIKKKTHKGLWRINNSPKINKKKQKKEINNMKTTNNGEALIHDQKTTAADGTERTFKNVSVPYADSKTGYASFSVNDGQVRPCTNKDGTVVEGRHNILLGDPAKTRKVSICTKKTKRKAEYATIELTNQQIADLYREDYKAYRARKAVETEAAAE